MGWWRRNVAGILTWSPDKFDGKPESKQVERQRRKEEKSRKRAEKKGKVTQSAISEIVSSDFDEEDAQDDDLDVFDPLATSRTFDEAHEYSFRPSQPNEGVRYHNPTNYQDFGHHGHVGGLAPDNTEDANSVPAPPSTRRSEEALRMYRPSPSSSDSISRAGGGGLLTAARRASSWGQGDEGGFEIESVRSMDVGHEMDSHMNARVMLVGAGGVHLGGAALPTPTVPTVIQIGTDTRSYPQSFASSDALYVSQSTYNGNVGYIRRPTLEHMTSGATVVEGLGSPADSRQQTQTVTASGTDTTIKNLDRRAEGARFDLGDTSTISSGHTDDEDDEESGEWHRGSEYASADEDQGSRRNRSPRDSRRSSTATGQDDYDDESGDDLSSHGPHYDDDDGTSERAVTFSPRRKPLQHEGGLDAADLRL